MNKDKALDSYALDCQNAANQFIEKSTRFGVKDTQFLAVAPSVQALQVGVLHHLEVVSEVAENQGTVNPDADDFATKDWHYYEQLVQEQARAELARVESLSELANVVEDAPFGQIAYRTPIRVHPQRFFHTYTCKHCNGNGNLTCDNCRGSGNVSCYSCGGNGKQSCSSCGGSGTVYSGNSQRSCNCSGGRVTCNSCGGSGDERCNNCNGSGAVTCNNCAGYGCFTRITVTTTYTTPQFDFVANEAAPSYFADIIHHIELPKLAQHGAVALTGEQKNIKEANLLFQYDAKLSICDLSIKVKNHPAKLIMYGEPPKFFDTGGILEKLLNDDFASLNQHVAGTQKLSPLFHHDAQKTLSVFIESEVHQEILKADAQGNSVDAIHVKLHRSVSTNYIKQTLASIKRSVSSVLLWSWAKWTLAIIAAATPIIICMVIYMERAKTHSIEAGADKLILFPWLPNASIAFDVALFTIPITLLGWYLMLWSNKRWLKQTGGATLLDWANNKNLLASKWLAMTACALVLIATSAIFSQNPVWIDKQGALYGKVGVFKAPDVIQAPVAPVSEILEAQKKKSKKRKH